MPLPKRVDKFSPVYLLVPHSRDQFPRAFWTRIRWIRFFFLCGVLVFLCANVVAVVAMYRFNTSVAFAMWASAILPASAALAQIALRRSAQRFKQQLREIDLAMCLECGYKLCGLPEKHRCPECGEEYFLQDVQSKWRDFLGDA